MNNLAVFGFFAFALRPIPPIVTTIGLKVSTHSEGTSQCFMVSARKL